MELQKYPAEIANRAQRTLELSGELNDAEIQLNKVEARIEFEIAFDPSFKNELQRKSVRAQKLLEDVEYQAVAFKVAKLTEQRAIARILLEQIENEFRVAKLQEQRSIAELTSQFNA
jgi:hypothetical protein